MDMRDLGVVIAAGGSSRRYGGKNKLLENLGEVPVFIHCVRVFRELCDAANIALVCPEDCMKDFQRALAEYTEPPLIKVVAGGATRTESVRNGLAALPDDIEFVAIHDGARPFVTVGLVTECLKIAREYGAGIAARPVTDTVKRVDSKEKVLETVDRTELRAVETPQIIKTSLLKEAYAKVDEEGKTFTDDAGLLENAGYPVHLVPHTSCNMKITYALDLMIAEALLRSGEGKSFFERNV